MSKADPSRDRSSALRRSRVARQGLVLGAVAGSMGIAGALGLSAAVNQAAPPFGTDNTSQGNTSQGNTSGGSPDDGANLSHVRILQGDDGEGGHESDDDGRAWVPAPPSPQFSTGGQNGGGQSGGGAGGGTGGQTAPQATTGGS